jgi:hypothetical protein
MINTISIILSLIILAFRLNVILRRDFTSSTEDSDNEIVSTLFEVLCWTILFIALIFFI